MIKRRSFISKVSLIPPQDLENYDLELTWLRRVVVYLMMWWISVK